MKDVYVGFKNLPLIGDIRLGHIKEPFSREELGSSKHMGHVERASLNEALVPSRHYDRVDIPACRSTLASISWRIWSVVIPSASASKLGIRRCLRAGRMDC